MKLSLLIAFVIITSAATAQTKKPAAKPPVKKAITEEAAKSEQSPKPSKEETTKWLNDKIMNYTIKDDEEEQEIEVAGGHIVYFEDWNHHTSISIPLIKDKNGSINTTISVIRDTIFFLLHKWNLIAFFGTYTEERWAIPICDIIKLDIYSVWGNDYFLEVITNGSTIEKYVRSKYPLKIDVETRKWNVQWAETKHTPKTEYTQIAHIPFDVNREPDLVERMNKAIRHLKTFCEAKPKETF